MLRLLTSSPRCLVAAAALALFSAGGCNRSSMRGPAAPLPDGGVEAKPPNSDTAEAGPSAPGDGATDRPSNPPETGTPDAKPDSERETAAPDVQPTAATPVTFIVRNQTSAVVYIQQHGYTRQGYWKLERDGAELPADDTCEFCDCSNCQGQCGRSIAKVKKLNPKEEHTFTWVGKLYIPVDLPNGNKCEREEVPSPGQLRVNVSFSKSFTVNTELGVPDEVVGPTETASATFNYPTTSPVTVVLTAP